MLKPFQIGDIVVLRSGGPKMTVTHVGFNRIEAQYFGRDGNLISTELPSDSLFYAEIDEADGETPVNDIPASQRIFAPYL